MQVLLSSISVLKSSTTSCPWMSPLKTTLPGNPFNDHYCSFSPGKVRSRLPSFSLIPTSGHYFSLFLENSYEQAIYPFIPFSDPQSLTNIYFQDFHVGSPSFCSLPNLPSSYVISTSLWKAHSIHSGLLFEEMLTNFRDPTSPHLSTPPKTSLGLTTSGNYVVLPSFTSSSHPPCPLTLCLFLDFSERNKGNTID